MQGVQIRPATKKEIPEILGLLYELGRKKPEKDSDVDAFRKLVKSYVTNSDKSILVAIRDEIEVVGAVSIIFLPRLNEINSEMYIPELVVQNKYQRKKIGKMLIDSCIDLAKEKKCHRIRLESGHKRKESHKFYLALGFEQSSLSFSMNLEK